MVQQKLKLLTGVKSGSGTNKKNRLYGSEKLVVKAYCRSFTAIASPRLAHQEKKYML